MAGLISDLVNILNEQAEAYEELTIIANRKKEYIIRNEADEIRSVAGRESELIGKSQKLDKKRDLVSNDIAEVLNINAADVQLTLLLDIIKDQPGCAELKQASDRIRIAVEHLKYANENNKMLLENALEYIEYSLNVIRSSTEAVPAAYGSENQKAPDQIKPLDLKS
jgi:flagellar biosynthesis/type III secretory pathway chaperone